MSIRSKAKRDAAKKKASSDTREPVLPRAIEPHAELRDHQGVLLGGIARQDEEWVLGLDGQIVGGSTSPATILAILKRAAAMQERAGHSIRLKFSDVLREAAHEEARSKGMTLEQFEAQLDQSLHEIVGAPTGAAGAPLRH